MEARRAVLRATRDVVPTGQLPSADLQPYSVDSVHRHPRGVAVRQQVARAVELEIRPRTLARILRSHRQRSEESSQRLEYDSTTSSSASPVKLET